MRIPCTQPEACMQHMMEQRPRGVAYLMDQTFIEPAMRAVGYEHTQVAFEFSGSSTPMGKRC